MKVRELADLHEQLLELKCSDGNCVVAKTTGQHTNGGCRCVSTRMGHEEVHKIKTVLRNYRKQVEILEGLLNEMDNNQANQT